MTRRPDPSPIRRAPAPGPLQDPAQGPLPGPLQHAPPAEDWSARAPASPPAAGAAAPPRGSEGEDSRPPRILAGPATQTRLLSPLPSQQQCRRLRAVVVVWGGEGQVVVSGTARRRAGRRGARTWRSVHRQTEANPGGARENGARANAATETAEKRWEWEGSAVLWPEHQTPGARARSGPRSHREPDAVSGTPMPQGPPEHGQALLPTHAPQHPSPLRYEQMRTAGHRTLGVGVGMAGQEEEEQEVGASPSTSQSHARNGCAGEAARFHHRSATSWMQFMRVNYRGPTGCGRLLPRCRGWRDGWVGDSWARIGPTHPGLQPPFHLSPAGSWGHHQGDQRTTRVAVQLHQC